MGDGYCFLAAVKNQRMDQNINMKLPHLKTLIHTHILENHNHHAESYFGIPDKFMNGVTEYLLGGTYILDAVDVVIAAAADALKCRSL